MEDFIEETTPAKILSNSETPKRVEGDVLVAVESAKTSSRVEGADGGKDLEVLLTPSLNNKNLLRDLVEDPEADEPVVKKHCF